MRRSWILRVSLLFCFTTSALSQSTNATISGQVADPTDQVIPDADVQILNEATGVQYVNKTNNSGVYTLSVLPPGQYRVQVSKIGFKTIVTPGVVLNVQSAVALNFTLPIGAASETVTVEAGSALLNTTDASVSTVVDRKFVENMPLNGRSFQDLISMTPGVVTQSPQASSNIGYRGDFSINGQRTESNYYMVDGVSAAASAGYPTGGGQSATGGTVAASTTLGTTQSLLGVDAMQEFRVQSSTYSAEYGRSPGGQISFLTRSGTNQFHGTVFDYLRNDVFDSNDWFNKHYGRAKTALRQNDFGGTFGGPLFPWHQRTHPTFIFVSYEGLRLRAPQAASIQYVPDMTLRQSAATTLQPILNAYPLPTAGGIDYGTLAQFISTYSLPGAIDSTSVRFDHTFSESLSGFFRWGTTPSSTSTRLLSSVQSIHGGSDTYTAGLTWQISQALTNELRLGYNSGEATLQSRLDSFGGAVPLNLRAAVGLASTTSAYTSFYLNFVGIGASYLTEMTGRNSNNQWNLVDTISATAGHHHIKLGADYRRIASPIIPPTPYLYTQFTTRQSLVTNSASTLQIKQSLSARPVFNELSVFAQDEWRLAPRLVLSSGLRWELAPPPTNSDGPNAYTLQGNISNPSQLTVAPQGTPLWNAAYYNFAPRIGLAWQAHTNPGWETVVRAGGGVFFDNDNAIAAGGYSGLGFSATKSYNGSPLPATSAQQNFGISVTPPYPTASVYAFPSHLQLPYSFQWNGALEQALSRSQSLTISYVGSNGRRLLQSQTINLASVNPNFGYVYYFPTGVTSNYQALQAKFQRSVANGIQALASYTWSHSIDFGSNNSALPLFRGNSDFDVRHNFQAGLTWNAPQVRSGKIGSVLLSQWGIDGRLISRTAFPVTLSGNTVSDPITGFYTTNVNLVSGQPIYLYGDSYPGGRALNRAAFALPSGTSPGNAPRNFIRGFGATQLNLALRRDFPLGENTSLQFRAETFNLLNHPVFGYVDPGLTSATFGQATKTLAQSLGTMSSLYQQGGPRSMQFALKVKF
ncbi:TonB-dependent receptor [Edaphobacter flagellatus]|uniref:TonB-dependent receptor n=1 Tax=Edaphobacter flagellatus TaxID=1933044 RepID=UPI0021B1B58A|nr:TonB-dependent receptor [Edaphobacter flagellatus]